MNNKTLKIISGGQTGVDRAALDFAMLNGFDYGGYIPKDRRAEDGQIDIKYKNLIETNSPEYAVRTEKNIIESDGTLIFTFGKTQGGTALTVHLAEQHKKPFLVVNMDGTLDQDVSIDIRKWIKKIRPSILNIAGPRESEKPGIYSLVMKTLTLVFICRQN